MIDFIGESGAEWSYDETALLAPPGGFGAVYEGTNEHGTAVAVKVVSLPDITDPRRSLVLREVDIAQLLHAEATEYILKVDDWKLLPTELLLVMAKADYSLHDGITKGIDDGAVLVAMQDIAAGLIELQQFGILHRDLKPRNVLFHDGKWKLADFGIARDMDSSTGTLTWARAGTLLYMAPELFDPPWNATIKSDLYAFGCLSYEAITGSVPFMTTDPNELVRMHRSEVPADLPTTVNALLRRIVGRLLMKNPSERPTDARAVSESLARITRSTGSEKRDKLQQLVAEHANERAIKEARNAAQDEEMREVHRQLDQAYVDLASILEEGYELLLQSLPDIRYEPKADEFRILGDEAWMRFRIWNHNRVSNDDALILVGEVDGENRRHGDEPPLANVMCELVEGRIEWYLGRYRRAAAPGINLGSANRRFGFQEYEFYSSEVFPWAQRISVGTTIFQRTIKVFEPEDVIDLFTSALALPHES